MHLGKFEKKLFSAFLAVGVFLFALPLTIYVFSGVWANKREYNATIEQAVDSQMTFSDLAFSITAALTNDLYQNRNIRAWAFTQSDTPAYYYYVTRAFEDLCNAMSGSPPVDFDLAITRLDMGSLVITPEGTLSKQNYYMHYSGLGAESQELIAEHFAHSNTALTLPIYKDDKLNEIFYITSRTQGAYNDILYMVRFKTDGLFNEHVPYILMSQNKEIAHSVIDKKDNEDISRTLAYINAHPDESEFTHNGIHTYVRDFELNSWRIAYLYPSAKQTLPVLLAACFIMLIGLLGLAVIAAKLLTSRLYRPVRELLSATSDADCAPAAVIGNVDEFAVLQSSAKRLKELHTEIDALLTERERTTSVKYSRDLLLGTATKDAVIDAPFCVSLIEIQSVNEIDIFRYKNALEDCISDIENAYCVNISGTRIAVILQCTTADKARSIIENILGSCDKKADLYAAISDIMQGSGNVHRCYEQAMQILEYKYMYDKCDILTMPQVKQVDSRMYYYPLQIETSFIQYLVGGGDGAVILFDELIEENTVNRKLPPEITKSFYLALISSISRAFQTLKLTPLELLARELDFEPLLTHWNDKNLSLQLHDLVVEIVSAVQSRIKTTDEKLIADMTAYIHENYSHDIMLEDLSHAFHISPKYCSALFKKLSDDNFKNYLNRYRIEVAKSILRGNPTVKTGDLSTMVGFNSAGSFIRVFSKYTGVTPKAFAETVMK